MGISKITRNFQITLPKDIRELVGLREGDKIIFSVEDTGIKISKVTRDAVKEAAGIWKDMKETGAEYQRRIRKEGEKRLKRLYGSH